MQRCGCKFFSAVRVAHQEHVLVKNNRKDFTGGSLGFLDKIRKAEGEPLCLRFALDSSTQILVSINEGRNHFSHSGHRNGLPLQPINCYEPWNKLPLDGRGDFSAVTYSERSAFDIRFDHLRTELPVIIDDIQESYRLKYLFACSSFPFSFRPALTRMVLLSFLFFFSVRSICIAMICIFQRIRISRFISILG